MLYLIVCVCDMPVRCFLCFSFDPLRRIYEATSYLWALGEMVSVGSVTSETKEKIYLISSNRFSVHLFLPILVISVHAYRSRRHDLVDFIYSLSA